jgi:hypothetical protein
MLAIHVLQLNLKAFMPFFRFCFGAIQNKTPVLQDGGKAGTQIGMRIGASGLAGFSSIANNGNKISNCIVTRHINKGLAVAYQDALMTPGTLPSRASSRKLMRDKPNFLIVALDLPVNVQRLTKRTADELRGSLDSFAWAE